MKTTLTEIELMPKDTFDQFFENIEKMSALFFEEQKNSKYKNMDILQKEILFHIDAIEKDVYNSQVKAYKAGTFDNYLNNFHEYAYDIGYAIEHIINEHKFGYYFTKFKDEAYVLKFEALSFMLESLECRIHLPKPPKRSAVLFELVKQEVENTPEIQSKGVWVQLENKIGKGRKIELTQRDSISMHRIYIDKRYNKSKVMPGKFIDEDLETGIKRVMTFSTMTGYVKEIKARLSSVQSKNIDSE